MEEGLGSQLVPSQEPQLPSIPLQGPQAPSRVQTRRSKVCPAQRGVPGRAAHPRTPHTGCVQADHSGVALGSSVFAHRLTGGRLPPQCGCWTHPPSATLLAPARSALRRLWSRPRMRKRPQRAMRWKCERSGPSSCSTTGLALLLLLLLLLLVLLFHHHRTQPPACLRAPAQPACSQQSLCSAQLCSGANCRVNSVCTAVCRCGR